MEDLVLEATDIDDGILGSLTFQGKKYGSKAQVVIGGSIDDPTNPFGIHIIDDRLGVDLNSEQSFRDLVLDYGDGHGNYGNLNLILSGDVNLNRGLIARYIAAGDVDAINTDYALYVNGRAQINDVLEVKAIRFIGAEAPEGSTDITTPANVIVVDNNTEEEHNNENILRDKKFTVTERIYLKNEDKLGASPTDPETYWGLMTGVTGSPTAFWGHDTLTFLESEFDYLVAQGDAGATENEIVVPNIESDTYKRYDFSRVVTATLGTINIEWTGYAYDPEGDITGSVIQQYYFESPYFRNRNKGSQINWMPGDARFGDDNFVLRVTADIIDTHKRNMNIFSVDAPIGLYIPVDAWMQYGKVATGDPNYRSFALWYPYENVVNTLNIRDFTKETNIGGGFNENGWRVGLYPRFVKQRRVPFDDSVRSNTERMYQGEWDLDLVIFPPKTGRCSNMIGKMYISYVQS
jgi:hypothetical protein